MNVNANVAPMSPQGLRDAVGVTMLKKSMDIQAQSALAMINAIPAPPSAANLPPNLGQNINTTA